MSYFISLRQRALPWLWMRSWAPGGKLVERWKDLSPPPTCPPSLSEESTCLREDSRKEEKAFTVLSCFLFFTVCLVLVSWGVYTHCFQTHIHSENAAACSALGLPAAIVCMCTSISQCVCRMRHCVVSILPCWKLSSGKSRSVSQLTRPERVCSVLHAAKDTVLKSRTPLCLLFTPLGSRSDAQSDTHGLNMTSSLHIKQRAHMQHSDKTLMCVCADNVQLFCLY